MGYFQVRYDSRVVNYNRRGFIRLATGQLLSLFDGFGFDQTSKADVNLVSPKPLTKKFHNFRSGF